MSQSEPSDSPRILVAVPVYNEQKYIQNVIAKIAEFASDDVLVIDDGSTDYTPMLLAMQPVDVIRHKTNLGYGRAIRDAFRWAQTYDYDWLITMDCDEQHEPESLPAFEEAILADDADVISGSRYVSTDQCGDPPPEERRKINRTITGWVNDQLHLDITDAFCGYKAYRVSALADLNLCVDGYAIPLQFWVQHAVAGHRVKELPIKLIYNDPNRSFGGPLDDAEQRLAHYREVFEREVDRHAEALEARNGQVTTTA
ncbi:glycosyltransferase family 2 protein [Algisphaera agarilytica]|uniref:Glycosyltransferase involved in cell wall biosynthesis n=1 Tax=Algisphaera agarilytica TaxID=1385975 RepID=A0A7X0H3V8_9BACT|nr:glycosyltransferase family 2 protein [Algisphaera agarilytica]MBB6428798.1 glycosyltransferase involved in cell wall biosynthesis [Algisphaera agarilytica]